MRSMGHFEIVHYRWHGLVFNTVCILERRKMVVSLQNGLVFWNYLMGTIPHIYAYLKSDFATNKKTSIREKTT